MKKGTIVATDLDGTYFYPKKRFGLVAKPNIRLSKRIIDDGGRVLFVTSRNRFIFNRLKKKLNTKNFDLIGSNGALIIKGGKIIRDISFDNDYLAKIIEAIDEKYAPKLLIFCTREKNMVFRSKKFTFLYDIYNFFQVAYGEPFERDTDSFYDQLTNGRVYKGIIFVGIGKKLKMKAQQMAKDLKEMFPDAEWNYSDQVVEFTPKGCSKSEGLHFYLDYNGVSPDNVVVVGDSGNDISMFDDFYERSYCMKRANAAVKTHAKHIIKRWSDLEEALYPSEDNESPEEGRGKNK